ncbi:MAG TPA: NAD-dependent epimerase/dehydratase family protein [Myxococcota bacterium]|nr:NAD-dependent epimerase/dehydratase family protein [Myxococcota bacterium]
MNALVTGATGFVGFHVARCLRERGHAVRALARGPERARELLAERGVEIAAGDMTNARAVGAALAGCDAVVHAAAAVSLDPRDAERLLRENVLGTQCVIGGACDAGIARIVYVSSLTTIWGPESANPSAHSALRAGTSGYARAKCEAERVVRARQEAGAKLAIVYPNGVIGPDDPGLSEAVRAFRGFTRATLATSGGLASVDVRDLALLCARLLETERSGRFVMGGQFHSWDQLVAELEPLVGRKIRRVRAPGWALRAGGSLLDALRAARAGRAPHGGATPSSASGAAAMITREAMEYATRMRALPNDPVLRELGVELRPLSETYQATLASLAAKRRSRQTIAATRERRA